MKEFGENISALVNGVLLFVTYVIGVGVSSLITKISGKKLLELKPSKKESYWTDLDLKKKPLKEYYRQF